MIEGNEYMRLDDLLSIVDPYEIYKYYLGYTPEIKRLYLSPFRPDNNPSFGVFIASDGTLLHKDFGDNRYKGNCISLVSQLFNISYKCAVNKIIKDLNPDRSLIQPRIFSPSHVKTKIQIISRPFNKLDLQYWYSYGIDIDDLIRERVYSVDKLFINKSFVYTHELCFAYLFVDGNEEFLKIYQPYGKTKWLSNVPVKKAFGLDDLEKSSNTVVVAKSKKDKMVLKKLITDVYEVQKEGTEVITPDIDDFFTRNYEHKFCFFDNDEPGKRANTSLNPLGYNWVNVPNSYHLEGIKDPSDLVKAYGYEPLRELLVEKGIPLKDNIIL